MHTHRQAQAHTGTHRHTQAHTGTHRQAQAGTGTHTGTHRQAQAHTQAHTQAGTGTHTGRHRHRQAQAHTGRHTKKTNKKNQKKCYFTCKARYNKSIRTTQKGQQKGKTTETKNQQQKRCFNKQVDASTSR